MDTAPQQKPKIVKLDRRKPTPLTFDFALTRKAFSLVASCIDDNGFHEAITTLAEELAAQFGCDRVCIGVVDGDDISIRAVSQSAQFNQDAALMRHIAAAMEEARDQECCVVFPAIAGGGSLVFTRAHESLAKINGECCICTVPLAHRTHVVGVISLERNRSDPFPPNTVHLLEIIATLIGPILDLKRRDERSIIRKLAESVSAMARNLIGARNYRTKITAAFFATVIGFFSIYTTDFRITAPSTLEGSVERVVTAPVDGYIAEVFSRPGDALEKGELIARLDEKDLSLEQLQWQSELQRLDKEYRSAMAKRDRTEVAILSTKKDQAQVQAELVEKELARLRVIAPFRGVILDGDLSKSLGAPVQRGEVLFKIAPLDGYRIILKVDESNIAYLKPGQAGHLTLSSFPGELLGLTVHSVTPVSTPEDGVNYFRVEALLLQADDRLKPGMSGVAKIYAGEAKLAWILTRRLVEWIKLAIWQYIP